MKTANLHPWNLSPKEAITLQQQLRNSVLLEDDFTTLRYVAGVDVGFSRVANRGRAAVVILDISDLTLVESAVAEGELHFPYIPGLLSFREMPLILKALSQLSIAPDLFLCDGQGIAHPRRFGIACHLGLFTSTPALGVGKTRLCGAYEEPPVQKGCWSPLIDDGSQIGAVLRSRTGVRPIFISPGQKITLSSSIEIVMRCLTRFRLPEAIRRAHTLSQFVQTTKE